MNARSLARSFVCQLTRVSERSLFVESEFQLESVSSSAKDGVPSRLLERSDARDMAPFVSRFIAHVLMNFFFREEGKGKAIGGDGV